MIINCKITNTFMECDMMRIVRLTRKYLYCKFEFLTPEDWEGTEKYARFENVKSGVKRSAVIDDEGMCLVPWECLTTEGYLNFSAHGERADGYTINTRVRRTLLEDTLDGGEDSRPPTPNLYIQMLEQRAKANEIVQTVAQELSEEEQIQARTNIGAASTNEVSKLSEEKVDGIGIKCLVALTQAEYDALEEKVATTLYIITDATSEDTGSGDDAEEETPTNMVAYILTDGASHIDTNYTPTLDDTYELTFRDNEPISGETYFGNAYFNCSSVGAPWFQITHGKKYAGVSVPTATAKMVLKRTPTELWLNGELSETLEVGEIPSVNWNKTLSLFSSRASSAEGSFISFSTFYFFGLKIWQGETLVHDYRPAKDTNEVACVYDLVTKEYLYNGGTGTLTYGEELEES